MDAVMIYAGMEGKPIPKIIQVIMVKIKVKIKLVSPKEMLVWPDLRLRSFFRLVL